MGIDLGRLAAQGRAHSMSRTWTPEELEALLTLEKERGLSRLVAADYVRNGIDSVEAYDKAIKKGVEPKKLAEIHAEAEAAIKETTKRAVEADETPKKKTRKATE